MLNKATNCHEIISYLCSNVLVLLFSVKNAEKPPVLKSVASKEDESPKPILPNVKEDSVKNVKTKESKNSSQKRKASNKLVFLDYFFHKLFTVHKLLLKYYSTDKKLEANWRFSICLLFIII